MKCLLCGDTKYVLCTNGVRDSTLCNVVSCQSCGLTQLDPPLGSSDIEDSIPLNEYTNKTLLEDYRERFAQDIKMQMDFLKNYISTEQELLELGCGHGFLIEALEKEGFHANGIEINKSRFSSAESICKGNIYDYNLQSTETLQELYGEYDAVFGFLFFQFISQPKLYLSRVRKLMKPNGRFILSVPNLNDHMLTKCSAYRDFFFQKSIVCYYTPKTITALLNNLGFTDIRIEGRQRYSFVNALHWLNVGKPQIDSPTYCVQNGLEWLELIYKKELERDLTCDTLFVSCKL